MCFNDNNNNRISIAPHVRNVGRRMLVARSSRSRTAGEWLLSRSEVVDVTASLAALDTTALCACSRRL